jgi:hypothetical protein
VHKITEAQKQSLTDRRNYATGKVPTTNFRESFCSAGHIQGIVGEKTAPNPFHSFIYLQIFYKG